MRRTPLLLAALGLASCDWSLHRMQQTDNCTVHGSTTLLPHGTCDMKPPAGIVAIDDDSLAPPPPLTRELVVRGRDRFDRICAVCHGHAGDGDSPVARAMKLRRPPSLVDATVAAFDDARILTVMTTGYGLMPSYASIVTPRDRVAILHYIRVLQHRQIAFDELSPAEQQEAQQWLR
jgi:mono/diheme cytochrome c family protein